MSTEFAGPESGLERSLPGSSYLSREDFEQEKESIFFRGWFCVGRQEEIPNAVDLLVRDVLGESVVIVRARDGALNAFHNVCRHRGCRLVLDDAPSLREEDLPDPDGHSRGAIRCLYHSWTFGRDGDLRAAPSLRETAQISKADFSLRPVAVGPPQHNAIVFTTT